MPGSPFYSGLFEGFQGRREKEYAQNQAADAEARKTEGNIYQYLLQSQDPKIQSLALAGLFESARPGSRAKGLKGFLGEVQGGEVYPQIMAAMNEQVPDTQAAPPATPQSAALPSTTPVHGGQMGAVAPSFQAPGPQTPQAQAPEAIAAALGQGAPESGFGAAGAPAPGVPQAGAPQAGMVGQPPPEHPTHRRGTGVPTAEEVAEMQARVATQTKIKVATEELTRAGATPEEIQRTVMGMLGAPQNNRMFAAPTFAVVDPQTGEPTPVSFDYSTGKYAFPDGTPVPRGVKFVRMSGAAGTGPALTSYIPDTPESREQLLTQYPSLALPPGPSPTGYLKVQARADGTAMAVPAEFTPPPDYTGTGTFAAPTSPTGREIRPILRTGGTGAPLGPAPAPEGQLTDQEREAKGWIEAVNRQINEDYVPGTPRDPGAYDTTTKRISNQKYQTYADLQKAAQPSGVAQPGDARVSVADRVQQRAEENRRRQQAAPAPPGPARARGAGPVGAR